MKIRILCALAVLMLIHACTPRSDPIISPTAATTPADQAEAVKANNQFALDLYRVLAAGNDKNIFFSPLSVSTNLAMVTAGARGQTETELRQALHFSLPAERANAAMGNLLYDLRERGSGRNYKMLIGNRVWVRQDTQVLPAYEDCLRKYFGAETGRFGSAAEGVTMVNDWTSRQTRGLIKKAISELDPATELVLVNAIYFSGEWEAQFDPRETSGHSFYLSSGHAIPVPMMFQAEYFLQVSRPNYNALIMPYKGDGLVMVVLLPDKPGYAMEEQNIWFSLQEIEKNLDGNTLSSLLRSKGEPEFLEALIPRLNLETEMNLNDALVALGVRTVFGTSADLSVASATKGLFVSQVSHKAVMELNEEGTRAAAATDGAEAASAAPIFYANHPFLFIIGDTKTGAILFMGRVMDPRKED